MSERIDYYDIEKIRAALVGRSIVNTLSEGDKYDRVLTFVLDDGTLLRAHATDGGCGCSNGCFTVDPGDTVRGTILNVEVEERPLKFDFTFGLASDAEKEGDPYPPGSEEYGSAVIRVFVYTELGQQTLLSSEGGDNGYYGWGFWLDVVREEGDGE